MRAALTLMGLVGLGLLFGSASPAQAACKKDAECRGGRLCSDGECGFASCDRDADCPAALACQDSVCIQPMARMAEPPGEPPCQGHQECPEGYLCEPLSGGCVLTGDLAGTWAMTGQTPDHAGYTGSVRLAPVVKTPTHAGCQSRPKSCRPAPPIYAISWQRGSGRRIDGIAIGTPATLFAAWGDGAHVVVYRLGSSGALSGVWAPLSRRPKHGVENGTGGRPGNFVGTHRIEGVDPTGKGYDDTLTVTRYGETYVLASQRGAHKIFGVGLRAGDYLGAAWGGKDVGVAAYEIQAGKLSGTWAGLEMKVPRTEDLQRTK